jgi:hypothetical protein
MAMGNWVSQMWNADGRKCAGTIFEMPGAAPYAITISKNFLDIEDPKAWARKRNQRFIAPLVRRIERGGRQDDYQDLRILTYRGPQDGLYGAIWAYNPEPRGVLFAGVAAYDDKGAYAGLLASSVEWFTRKLNSDLGGRLPRDVFGLLRLS